MRPGRRRLSPTEPVADLVVRLRHVVVAFWIVAAVVTTLTLPTLGEARAGALGSLVPRDAPAIETQRRSFEIFRLPVLSNTMVVQRRAEGLSGDAQTAVFARALRINQRRYPDLLSVELALPLTNTFRLAPGSAEEGTTALTYLYFRPDVGLVDRHKLAHWFSERRLVAPEDGLVGVTGVVPARVEQGLLIQQALPLIELATVLLIAAVIGFTFRSVVAPLVTLVAVAAAYLVSVRVVAAVGGSFGIAVPRELEPVILVLILGIVTDYCVFYLSGLRHRLREGDERLEAARRTAVEFTPIVFTAGLIVSAGTASLLAAKLEFFRVFGPGLALTVLVGLLLTVTFVPACLALLGGLVFWPRASRPDTAAARRRAAGRLWRTHVGRLARSPRAAAVVVAVGAVLLLAAASGVVRADLALTPIETLPASNEANEAAEAAALGFAPGVVAPTLVLVEGENVVLQRRALLRLQEVLEEQPGVAAVVGPRQLPAEVPIGVVVSVRGDAVRYIVVLEEPPLGSSAVADLRRLRDRMPGLVEHAGLAGVTFGIGGNTALAEETVDTILSDLVRIAIAALAVNLLLLVVFLRALVAPLYLLATSVLALSATLGLTVYVFQAVLGAPHITYYVPFMAAVLLVSLGSDYNIFLVGRIWQEARERPLDEAIAVATPRASRAISVAGVALASSFALLALVPLGSFREFAFTMFVGVLLEAFVVRPYLVPALVSLVGRRSAWPGRLRPPPAARAPRA